MNRELMLQNLNSYPNKIWNVIIIGGNAIGLSTAIVTTSGDFATLLIEPSDFTKGTSRKRTK